MKNKKKLFTIIFECDVLDPNLYKISGFMSRAGLGIERLGCPFNVEIKTTAQPTALYIKEIGCKISEFYKKEGYKVYGIYHKATYAVAD